MAESNTLKPKSKNWRELVMFLAAKIADDCGNAELANLIAAWKVPYIDSGGGWIARRRVGLSGFEIEGPFWQSFNKPGEREEVVIPIPASAWEYQKESCACDCACHTEKEVAHA